MVSELRRPRPHGGVVAWLKSVSDEDLHLSAVTLGELQAGVEITRAQDPAKAGAIEAWVDQIAEAHAVLPIDGRCLRMWARLLRGKSDELIEDGMIAATAVVHQLTVVTRNVRDYSQFPVKTLDPFAVGRGRR